MSLGAEGGHWRRCDVAGSGKRSLRAMRGHWERRDVAESGRMSLGAEGQSLLGAVRHRWGGRRLLGEVGRR
jgi:hypothetical protein